ncbi:MAG: type II toxin-antitoxin system RelE/ParE family toxin [Proteobacteria bacterium]|nr:type II toxin-antitoxin system RelE/ParE family toxin [Pseudomonadota bacterium]
MGNRKRIKFLGDSLDGLRSFSDSARKDAGFQLDRVQQGLDPDDWKPMQTIGQGAREIRIRDTSGAFRVLYVVKFVDAIYVLHCFQKKTQKTRKADIDLAKARLEQLLKDLNR